MNAARGGAKAIPVAFTRTSRRSAATNASELTYVCLPILNGFDGSKRGLLGEGFTHGASGRLDLSSSQARVLVPSDVLIFDGPDWDPTIHWRHLPRHGPGKENPKDGSDYPQTEEPFGYPHGRALLLG